MWKIKPAVKFPNQKYNIIGPQRGKLFLMGLGLTYCFKIFNLTQITF